MKTLDLTTLPENERGLAIDKEIAEAFELDVQECSYCGKSHEMNTGEKPKPFHQSIDLCFALAKENGIILILSGGEICNARIKSLEAFPKTSLHQSPSMACCLALLKFKGVEVRL